MLNVFCFTLSAILLEQGLCTKYQNESMNPQYNEDDFLFKFLLLSSFFRITSLQVIKEEPYN